MRGKRNSYETVQKVNESRAHQRKIYYGYICKDRDAVAEIEERVKSKWIYSECINGPLALPEVLNRDQLV